MTNMEKFRITEDAVKAWNEYTEGKEIYLCLDDWLKEEYVEPHELTLLEAAVGVTKAWNSNGPDGTLVAIADKIVTLSDAIGREKAKSVRNCDKLTQDEALEAFKSMCSIHRCEDCDFDVPGEGRKGCIVRWLYSRA